MAGNSMNGLTSGIEAITPQPNATIPRYMIVHRVECPRSIPNHSAHSHLSLYLDVPRLFAGDNKASPLRGRIPDEKAQLRAKKDPDISFIIHRTYNCLEYHNAIFEALRETSADPLLPAQRSQMYLLPSDAFNAVAEREYMEIISTGLNDAIEVVKGSDTRQDSLDKSLLLGWNREHNMVAPYFHLYHTRNLLRDHVSQLPEHQSQHINLLLNYLDKSFGPDYEEAEKLFDDGLVNRKHFHKLFGPREILVTVEGGHHIAMVSRYPPLAGSSPIRLECETWEFNGRFAKYKRTIIIPWPKHAAGLNAVPIKSLDIFPLKFDARLKDRLRERGKFCWQLRKPRLVLYNAPRDLLDYRMENGRYMVDIDTYRRLHKLNTIENLATEQVEGYLSLKATELDSPPAGSFALLLPPITYGFNFHDKKWRKLAIEYATDVVWKKDMFDKLIIQQDDRDILSALLLGNKVSRNATARPSQGRVILFFGEARIGKTFAAEALAELARKPLYQLLPSEIGIEPNQAANNIEEAFYLGGIWDAVMNLEDLDMFFGRSVDQNMAAEARTSIILQAIKHYPGIVVLTMKHDASDGPYGPLLHRVQKAIHLESR